MAPGFFSAIVFKNLPVSFEVSGWAQRPAQKRTAHRGEETGTAETLAVEQVLPAVAPEGVAAVLDVFDVVGGRVPRALLDPESQREVANESQGLGSKRGVGKPGGAALENWPS